MNKLKIFWAKFMVIRFFLWQGYVLRFFEFHKLYLTWCKEYKVKYYEMVLKRFEELADKKRGKR